MLGHITRDGELAAAAGFGGVWWTCFFLRSFSHVHFPLQVVSFCDHNPDAGHGLAGLGAERFDTPREVAEQADVVITALTIPPVVKDCVLGDDGVLSGLRQGGLWIDHSTTDYNQTKDLAEIAIGNGQQVLEAPITGGLTLLQEVRARARTRAR